MGQIATIKMQTEQNDIVEVPVFEIEDVEAPAVKVQTGNGTGALNITNPDKAEINQLRVQTNNGVKAVRNTILHVDADFTTNDQILELTIYEDTDQDGEWDNKTALDLEDGTNIYELQPTDIEGKEESEYWIELHFENPDIEKTAEVTEITLQI